MQIKKKRRLQHFFPADPKLGPRAISALQHPEIFSTPRKIQHRFFPADPKLMHEASSALQHLENCLQHPEKYKTDFFRRIRDYIPTPSYKIRQDP